METAFDLAVAQVRDGANPEDLARELVGQMTVKERCSLLDGDTPFWKGMRDIVRHGYNATPLVAGAVPRLGVPGIRWVDGPRGCAIPGSTCFPVTMARGATWDPELEERVGEAIGKEVRAQGGNYGGYTVVNVLRHPGWGRAQETYGEDPVHLGVMGVALTTGVQRHAMSAVKHYALNSIEDSRFTLDVTVDEDVLHECYLPHFRAVVDAGTAGISTAYNKVNGTYCGEHPQLLSEIPRGEWGFTGIVSSDFVLGLSQPVGSLHAGLDVEMPVRQQRHRAVPKALADGSLPMEVVDRSALRIIATQLRHTARFDETAPTAAVVACDEHRSLAHEVAARSMVLLHNARPDGTPLLPLPADIPTIAVFGRLAEATNLGDHGSSDAHPPSTSTPLDGLRRALPGSAVLHHRTYDSARAAAAAADAAACVVVVGYTSEDEGEKFVPSHREFARFPFPATLPVVPHLMEWSAKRVAQKGGDRHDLRLRPEDRQLVRSVAAANPNTIVVVVAGSAVHLEDLPQRAAATVIAWYAGMEGGRALADVLLGRREPGGRLPFVMAADPRHLPPFDPEATSTHYDRWWGYRKLDREGNAPAFPFGFGLGYTTFALSDATLDQPDGHPGSVELTVENTGTRRGSTVVQVYGADAERPDRPARQLLGFARVDLAPGQSERVRVDVSLQPLRRRDVSRAAWTEPSTSLRLEIGQHCGDPAALVVSTRVVA